MPLQKHKREDFALPQCCRSTMVVKQAAQLSKIVFLLYFLSIIGYGFNGTCTDGIWRVDIKETKLCLPEQTVD